MKDTVDISEIVGNKLERINNHLAHGIYLGTDGIIDGLVSELAGITWRDLLKAYNKTYRSRRRKPIEDILREAASRGALCETEDASGDLLISYQGLRFRYRCSRNGRSLKCPAFDVVRVPAKTYMITFEADRMFDCMEELADAVPVIRKHIEALAMEIRKKQMISSISCPSIELEADRRLLSKGIKYYVNNDSGEVHIYVNIVKEIWFKGPIDMESMDRVLSLVPYAIKRPDHLKDLGPGFKSFHDFMSKSEKAWKRYHEERARENKG